MKKLFLSAVFACTFFTLAFSQFEMENLYGGVTFGWAQPVGKFTEIANGGLNYNIEAGYRIMDKLGVGIEYSASATLGIGDNGLNIYGETSYLAKANYRFLDRRFSPYAGLGLGLGQVSEPDLTINDVTTEGATAFGFSTVIEAGLDIYGVILAYRFNYSGNTPKEPVYNVNGANIPVTMHQFVVGYVYKFRSY